MRTCVVGFNQSTYKVRFVSRNVWKVRISGKCELLRSVHTGNIDKTCYSTFKEVLNVIRCWISSMFK